MNPASPTDAGKAAGTNSDYPPPGPARTAPPEPPAGASRRSQRALDWFTFFVADVQTGFGPFISVYLTAHQWAQVDIGLVLTAGGLAALAFQMPGGAPPRRRAIGAARRRLRDDRDQRERAGAGAVADLSGRARRANPPCRRQLRAQSGDRRDQPGTRRSRRASASGSAATRASPRSGAVSRRRAWARPAISCRTRRSSWSPRCWRFPRSSRSRISRANEIDPVRAHGGLAQGTHGHDGSGAAHPSHQPVAADLCRLRRHLPARERGHASADGEHRHHALEHLGNDIGRGLHRGAATRGRGDFADGRTLGATMGAAADPAARLRRIADPRAAVHGGDGPVTCSSPCSCSTESVPPCSACWCL